MLFLPLVENAFKHSASHTRFETSIDIHLMVDQEQLIFKVKKGKHVKYPINVAHQQCRAMRHFFNLPCPNFQ